MPGVLVVDDDRSVLRLVEKALEEEEIQVITASSAEEGMAALTRQSPEVILLDVVLPEMNGLEFARKIKELNAKLPVIFITASDASDTAIEAMKLGAYDYLLKPLEKQRVVELVFRARETARLMQAPVQFHENPQLGQESGDLLVGRSPRMLEVYKQIGRVAAQDVSVLIRGESGTGKELIARAIYQHSHRRDRTFLAVNCAALSDTLLESELFGHEKGAFTGADRRHIGKFEQCNGGTIFLDEIGDMSPSTQSKVLRLLQEQRFERVGGSETIQTDVRIISATNRPLEEMIDEGQFRLDLFHRLNTFEIVVPPLRQRGPDVELLVEYFLRRFNKHLGKRMTGVSPEALHLLKTYRWPGNIRELQSVIGKSMLMATGPVLVPEFLPAELRSETSPASAPATATAQPTNGEDVGEMDFSGFLAEREQSDSNNLYAESVEWMERHLLTRVLQATAGNQSKAAERLGITRGSLRNKIRSLGITIGHVVNPETPDAD